MTKEPTLAFIIAHKYVRGYVSYLQYYIDNIHKCYPNALVIVVDNNSKYKDDVFSKLIPSDNLVLLENKIDCKFEIGAYQVGISYLLSHGLVNDYDFVVCTQDNYILKNKYDFNILKSSGVGVAPIVGWKNDLAFMHIIQSVLNHFGLFNRLDETNICWCCSFVVSKHKIRQLYDYLKQIVIVNREASMACERFLGRLFLEINNGINFSIDGSDNTYNVDGVNYDCNNVNALSVVDKYFCKTSQKKNEGTYEG